MDETRINKEAARKFVEGMGQDFAGAIDLAMADDCRIVTMGTTAISGERTKAQALQAKPTGAPGDIDSIMTSASERPTAPAKKGPDEAPPPTPVKSDVPF